MVTAGDIGTRALRRLGVVGADATPDATDSTTAFQQLNGMVGDWALQELLVHAIARRVYPLVANQSSYTIGPGGNFDQARPLAIERASIIPNRNDADLLEIPLDPPLTLAAYQGIAIKSTTSTYPNRLYFDHDWVAGLARIVVYPVPDNSDADLVLYTPTALAAFADRSTEYSFSPGYERALELNLAMELADVYDVPPTSRLERMAQTALDHIKRANYRPGHLGLPDDSFVRGHYDIYSDEHR